MFPRTRWFAVLVGFLSASTFPAATRYVAPNGKDSNAGTIEAPFATIPRAQDAVAPGDTVLIRGGSYAMTETQIAKKVGQYACLIFLDKSGTPGKRINYWAYPGDLIKPRQPNGDLPDVPFMHLAPNSGAIDKGVDVGLPFKGTAPDLGHSNGLQRSRRRTGSLAQV